MTGGRLVLMGSGETAPTMVDVHRTVLAAARQGPILVLDTPYGFQENAEGITARTVSYLERAVGREAEGMSWRDTLSGPELDRALHAVRSADVVLAGPGSPTYALRQWTGTGLVEALCTAVQSGATVIFSSAAAVTLGIVSVPVYEIYKCGQDPRWHPGLDLLSKLVGLQVALIPHFDNREGGTHDTRYCYLGERRLRLLETSLPAGTHVLGVDEHTALVLNPDTATACVLGHGAVTVRGSGREYVLPAGTTAPITELEPQRHTVVTPTQSVAPNADPTTPVPVSLSEEVSLARAEFDAALAAADADAAATTLLRLESVLRDWATDTDDVTSNDAEHARSVLRDMVLTLADTARRGLRDPRHALTPALEPLLALRDEARRACDYALADGIRDALTKAGVRLHDTRHGTEWHLPEMVKQTLRI